MELDIIPTAINTVADLFDLTVSSWRMIVIVTMSAVSGYSYFGRSASGSLFGWIFQPVKVLIGSFAAFPLCYLIWQAGEHFWQTGNTLALAFAIGLATLFHLLFRGTSYQVGGK